MEFMADFVELKEKYLPTDGDWYKVSGILTEEDIRNINLLPRKTILVIDNTKGLSSDVIRKITSDNISFSVVGGLNYFNKEKYKTKDYISRTMMSPDGLAQVIEYYEKIESQISSEWTETQKCMFLYDALVSDFTYEANYDTQITKGVAERGLNGVLYKKLVCAGFAMVFKEGLDRMNINNVYQNRKGLHSWNIVELEGNLRGLEVTWDCYNKGADNVCQFRYFGQDPNFYENKDHALSSEVEDLNWDFEEEVKTTTIYEEETQYDLTPFSVEELRANYRVIAEAIKARQIDQRPLFKNEEEERTLLPIDRIRSVYQKQCELEQPFILLYQFLESSNLLEDESYDFLKIRQAFIGDILGTLPSGFVSRNTSIFDGSNIGMESLSNCEFSTNGDYMAPFGTKRSVAHIENIIDENTRNSVFQQLKQRLHEYSIEYLMKLFDTSENMLSKYQQLQSLEVEKDLNLQALIVGKNTLLSSGMSKENIEQKVDKIETYFNSTRQLSAITDEEQAKRNLDFLYGIFGDVNEVRQMCEQYDGYVFTEKEWQKKRTDAQYIMQVFDKNVFRKMNITFEQVQMVLNDLFDNTYAQNLHDDFGGKIR